MKYFQIIMLTDGRTCVIRNGTECDAEALLSIFILTHLQQVRKMAAQARAAGLNIDYFPTNFVARDGLIWYVDYECNDYMEEWDFEHWGIKYWSRTPEFEEYLKRSKHDHV